MYDNLKDWFEPIQEIFVDEYGYGHDDKLMASLRKASNEEVILQFSGFELILSLDGTYILNDTSGG